MSFGRPARVAPSPKQIAYEAAVAGIRKVADCQRCPLHSMLKDRIVPPHGNRTASIAIVGEGPGYVEERYHKPFIGPAGQMLEWLLKQAGAPRRQDLWVTNAACCRPRAFPITDEHGNELQYLTERDTIEASTQKYCRTRLHRELSQVAPRIVLAVGNFALKSLTGQIGITARHGATIPADIDGHSCLVVPVLHPAALLRNPKNTYGVIKVLERVTHMAADGILPDDTVYGERHCISPYHPAGPDGALDELEAAVDDIVAHNKEIAIDVESTTEHPRTASLTIVGFATYTDAYAVTIVAWNRETQTFEECWTPAQERRRDAILAKLLSSRVRKWYWHCSFDITMLERYYPMLRGPHEDGLHWDWLTQPEKDHHLSFVAQTHLIIPPWKVDFWDKQNAGTATHSDLDVYNCDDCRYTIHIVPYMRQAAYRRGVQHLVEHQMEVDEMARRAELYGVPLHKGTWNKLYETYSKQRQDNLDQLRAAVRGHEADLARSVHDQRVQEAKNRARRTGKYNEPAYKIITADEFNPRSPHHSRWFLYEHLQLNVSRLTDGGESKDESRKLPSTSYKGVLNYLSKPLVKAYVNFHEFDYKAEKLMMPLKRKAEEDPDEPEWWRLWVGWNACGTKGSRWTSKLINLQNFEKKMRKLLRAKPGRVWVGCDLAQVEFRVAACLAGLTELFPLFNQEPFDEDLEPWKKFDPDYDAHSITAVQVYKDSYTKQSQEFAQCMIWLCNATGLTAPEVLKLDIAALEKTVAGVLLRALKAKKLLGPWRTLVKRVTFALFYGARPKKILTSLLEDRRLAPELRATLDLRRIEDIWNGFNARFPQWERWANAEMDTAYQLGYQQFPPLNRRRWWTQKELESNKLKNTPIQVAAGDIFNVMAKRATRRIDEEGLDAVFSIHGHDCILLDTREAHAPRVRDIVNEEFQDTLVGPKGSVRVYGQASIGPTVADVG